MADHVWTTGSRFARVATAAAIAVAAAVVALGSSARPASASELGAIGAVLPTHTSDSQPDAFVDGPDGNMWFTELTGNAIGRVTPSGAMVEFPLAAGSSPSGITSGSGGDVWFTESGAHAIGSITTGGSVTLYGGLTGEPGAIAVGPNGNLWFTEPASDRIGTMTPGGSLTEFTLSAGSDPLGIAAGPDGNLWFTEGSADRIGDITPAGAVTTYTAGLSLGSDPDAIALGPDGNLWFTEKIGFNVGRITPAGSVTEFAIPTSVSNPEGITAGPDGNLWFTESGTSKVGRITTSGTFVEFPVFGGTGSPVGIATGEDGNLWFSDGVGRIETIGAAAPAALITAPVAEGAAEVTTPENCVGDRWSNWAGQQPQVMSYAWAFAGAAVASGETFVPPSSEAGGTLDCTVTVFYPLLGVTVAATSAVVSLTGLATGTPGEVGQSGAAGAAGAAGGTGQAGPAGATGKVELVTCQPKASTETIGGKPVKVIETICKVKVVTRTVTFTTTTEKASLSQKGKLVASGLEGRIRGHVELVISEVKKLPRGHYLLRLAHRRTSTVMIG